MLISKIDQELLQEIIEWRRDFHRYPEISEHEERTSKVISVLLKKMGVEVKTYPSHHGICGIIQGKPGGPVIALRAEMDALPLSEENDTEYKSLEFGAMHACGHDAHMAMALGVTKILAMTKDEWQGTVKVIFQGAEELAPIGGAKRLIKDGVLESPKVDAIFALHVSTEMPTGIIAIRPRAMMASSDPIKLEIHGVGSHAAEPHKGIDSIGIAAEVIKGTQHIISRQINPSENATISIGTIHGGERYNVVAKKVVMEGTVRSHNEEVRNKLAKSLQKLVDGLSAAYGAKIDLDYRFGYPVLSNWDEPYKIVLEAAKRTIGEENINTNVMPSLSAEDFANFLTAAPGAFFWLGCCKPGTEPRAAHSSSFDIDEDSMEVGVRVMLATILEALAFYKK